ncbi:sulfotransferase domain-containing protein [Desulfobacula sp.]|uniref:sulfotransferase domain-containing protein n=1 Tax=Desulfobacula sp. TaxID=2593537 RepID=UPI001EC6E8DD|nr:sulfotransferase domain-containing protein [Desulfobacula sp.]
MKSILHNILGSKKKKSFVTIVSGLPRSGTSMMMQMLEAGGMTIMTDKIRKPDEDNPRGYYEFEKVKKIKEDASWLWNCEGKAFKMVSALLYDLPMERGYKIIFIRRKMEEMLASQAAMLERMGRKGADISDEEMAEKYFTHLRDIENWLAQQKVIDVLYISYNDVIMYPIENASTVNSFLGNWLNVEKMSSVVDKSLHRQRSQKDH